MSISLITPHYNDLEGLKHIYKCLKLQTLNAWDWVIVDDKSDDDTQKELEKWFNTLADKKVQLFLNSKKTNGSVCRNLGVDSAKSDILVFLDSDDEITPEFVLNRNIEVDDFTVFINFGILNEKGKREFKINMQKDYLNCFLSANFIWQTSCILWRKSFFKTIGEFNSELLRLQDVELAIRALMKSENYSVINNNVDFYYKVKPIRSRKNFVQPVCNAVHLLVSKLLQADALDKHQYSLLSGYYFLTVRYFERSESKAHLNLVLRNLNLFYKKDYVSFKNYILGFITLQLYRFDMLSSNIFLRINRYLFKPKNL